jgi:CIC family chloride channel protein
MPINPINFLPTPNAQGIAEDEDRLPEHPLHWLMLMMTAAFVGGAIGLVGVAFRILLDDAGRLRLIVAGFAHAHAPPWIGWAIPTALCAFGAGLGTWLTQHLAPQTAGSGIPRIEAVLRSHLRPATALILPVKFFGGLLGIGSGLALGREGPTVQMGGTIGRLVSDALRKIVPDPWTLIAAGAGAGLAVAFNAPLTAVLFVMEELLHRFSARVFSATLVACISSTLVLRAIMGNKTDFVVAPFGMLHATVLPEYLILGAVAGVMGVSFNLSLMGTLRQFDRVRHWPRGVVGALIGAVAGLLLWFAPGIVGSGEALAGSVITRQFGFGTLLGVFVLRYALTLISYGTGAPGGIFAPLLVLGALLGNAFGTLAVRFSHATADPGAFAIVSMAALFTAVVRSPLTGVVLLLEMTGRWTLILPMMAASVTAYAIPELMRNPPLYDSLRERNEVVEKEEIREARKAKKKTDATAG